MQKFGHLAMQQHTSVQNISKKRVVLRRSMLRHVSYHLIELRSMIKQLLQPHYCQWHCFYWTAWQTHTHTHTKGACDAAVESGRCMLSRPTECPCWALAGIKAPSRPIQISVCPLLASSCIRTQWVTGQHEARMLAESNKVCPFETWKLAGLHNTWLQLWAAVKVSALLKRDYFS